MRWPKETMRQYGEWSSKADGTVKIEILTVKNISISSANTSGTKRESHERKESKTLVIGGLPNSLRYLRLTRHEKIELQGTHHKKKTVKRKSEQGGFKIETNGDKMEPP